MNCGLNFQTYRVLKIRNLKCSSPEIFKDHFNGHCALKARKTPPPKAPAHPKFLRFQQAPKANKIFKKSFDNGLILMV